MDDDSDNFPTGCAFPAAWSTNADPNVGWSVSNDVFFGTPCALRSARMLSPAQDFTTYGNSDVSYTATFLAGNVTFNYKMSSYPTYGYFEFLVDGVVVKNDTGEVGWTGYTYAISAGTHTLTWRYKNRLYFYCANASPPPPAGAACADRVWIDTVVLPTGAPVTLQGVVSRKSHPSAGTFDLAIDSGQAIGGSVTSEPRPKSSNTHAVVFNFNAGVATPGTVTCVDAASASVSCSASVSGSSVVVTLTGLADGKRATVSLTNVNASGTNVSASIGFLVGDLNGDRSVTASDILLAKGKTGQSVSASTYKYDDDLSGILDSADVTAVKANAGVSI